MPARRLRALSSIAEQQPSSGEVLPSSIVPSGSSIADAGAPVEAARRAVGGTTGRSAFSTPSLDMSREMRADWTGSVMSRFSATSAL